MACPFATCAEEEQGWTIQSGDASEELTFEFIANFTTIGAIVANMNLDIGDALDPLSIEIPSMAGIEITRAKFDSSSTEYPNEFIIDITNNFIQDFNMTMNFENIFKYTTDSEGNENLTQPLVISMVIQPGDTLKEVIDTPGAGDAYLGGILMGKLTGMHIFEAMKVGAVMASFCIEGISVEGLLNISKKEFEDRLNLMNSNHTS